MKDFIAVVDHFNNKVTKYQDFDKEADADAHVAEYGGFVVVNPGGSQSYWVVDSVAQTVTFDKAQFDIDKAHIAATAYRASRKADYPPIGDQLDALMKQLNYDRTKGRELIQDMDDVLGLVLAVKAKYKKPD